VNKYQATGSLLKRKQEWSLQALSEETLDDDAYINHYVHMIKYNSIQVSNSYMFWHQGAIMKELFRIVFWIVFYQMHILVDVLIMRIGMV
jgi:hypothetical protein